MKMISAALLMASSLLLATDQSGWAETKAVIAVFVTDEGNVGVQSRVITGDDKEVLTTDPQGKLEIQRSCNSGELIKANPIESVVYYASTPTSCQENLTIKVRRRDFADNAVLGFWKHTYVAADGNQYSTGSTATLKSTIEQFVIAGGTGGKCIVAIDPTVVTVVWAQPSMLSGVPQIAKSYESDAPWDAVPRQFSFEGSCADSQQKIDEKLAGVYKDMIATMKSQEVWGTQAISTELQKQGEGKLVPIAASDKGAIWTRELMTGQNYPQ